jgi:hypothetical protein
MPEPVKVFVSYANQDRLFAMRLVTDLKAGGAEVWWDVAGIDEGDFLRKIDEALQKCNWFVFVLTPNAIASTWVQREVYAAIHRSEQGFMKGVLPVLGAPTDLKTIPPLWASLHRYDAVANYKGEIERLVGALGLAAKKGLPAKPRRAANKYLPIFRLQEAQDRWDEIIADCNRENPDTTLLLTPSRPIELVDGTPPILVVELRGIFGTNVLGNEDVQQFLARSVTKMLDTPMQIRFTR